RLGVRMPPRPPSTAPVRRRAAARAGDADAIGLESLVVPVHRLSVRGVAPPLVARELVAVLVELFPRRAVRLGGGDSAGAGAAGRGVGVGGGGGGGAAGSFEWAEFGDGAGRRLRLGVEGPLVDDARAALAMLAQVTSLALEIASLRGFAESRAAAAEDEP